MKSVTKSAVKTILKFILIFSTLAVLVFPQAKGRIVGKVVDAKTGEGIIGANILVVGTNFGSATDLDGNYSITSISKGEYSLTFSMIGYTKQTVTNIIIKENEATKIDIALTEESYETQEVVVTAKALLNTDASMLSKRQKSVSVSDAISAETISRAGAGNAADAMKKVTGASVVGGKYVFIRGLGDRYSSTQLNGAELPSADPDKKSFNLDLFPSNLLDNLVTIKSFTPDKPGNFSGGLVDVATKNYPEKFTFNLSTSVSGNSLTTFNNNFLTYSGSSTDWLGYDDGKRSIPGFVLNKDIKIPTVIEARSNKDKAMILDQYSKAFSSTMEPISKKAPVNQSYSISVGDQLSLFNQPFGYSASLTYSSNYSFYDKGEIGRWELSGKLAEVDGLNNYMLLSDSKSQEDVLWGGLLNVAYKPHQFHDLAFRVLYTQSGESTTRFQEGGWVDQLGENGVYQTRSLLYTERNLMSYQLTGEHHLASLLNSQIKWTASMSSSKQNEPDLRFFSNDYFIDDEGVKQYNINKNSYNEPTRFFRDLNESNFNFNLDWSIPFKQWSGLTGKIKLGGSYVDVDRDFREKRYEYRKSLASFNGNINDYLNDQIGIVLEENNRYYFGAYLFDASSDRSNYDGKQNVYAGFAMVELPISEDLRFIGGARYETTFIETISLDPTAPIGKLENKDILPSVNIIYALSEKMNLRASYGKTLARPNMRELAPFRSFEFLGDYIFTGNAGLKRTLIDNLDLRWEWFQRPGDIYAISLFYKKFDNPMERTFDPTTELISYQNIPSGKTYGIEFELRRNLDFIGEAFNNFLFNMNFSYVVSKVDIPEEEYNLLILPFDPTAKQERPLYGQSPYIVNLELSYINNDFGTSASVFYNVFGERLSEVTLGITPDVYEQPVNTVDLSVSQNLGYGLKLKMTAKNLLDEKNKKTINLKGKEYIYHAYDKGRSYSFGLSFGL